MPKRITFCLFSLFICFFSLSVLAQQEANQQDVLVEDVEFRGNRRIPKDTLSYSVTTKQGDRFNRAQAQRDSWFPLCTARRTRPGD